MLSLPPAASAQPQYEFFLVESFNPGYDLAETFVFDLNNSNVGLGSDTFGAFLWTEADDKIQLPWSGINSLNNLGWVNYGNVLYHPDTQEEIVIPSPSSAFPQRTLLEVNDNMVGVGVSGHSGPGCEPFDCTYDCSKAFAWDEVNGSYHVPVENLKAFHAVNIHNVAVGVIIINCDDTRGVVYDLNNGEWINLSDLLPPLDLLGIPAQIWPTDINDLGQVIGTATSGSEPQKPFVWTEADGFTFLPIIPGGEYGYMYVNSINNNGVVVGEALDWDVFDWKSFIWDPVNGIRVLEDLVDEPTNFMLENAYDINDNGWIAGSGHFGPAWATQRGYVLKPLESGGQCDTFERVDSPSPGSEGSFLNDVSGVAADDVWAIGSYRVPGIPSGSDELPLAIHWDGTSWSMATLPTLPAPPNGPNVTLHGVQAFANGEVWTVGSAVPADSRSEPQTLALRFDGSSWEVIPTPSATPEESNSEFFAIGGVAADDFWAVGHRAGFLAAHWDGTGWETFDVPAGTFEYQHLIAVSALASDDVWVLGRTGLGGVEPWIVHWNGSSWTTPIPQPSDALYSSPTDIKAFAADDIWISVNSDVGAGPQFLHWDGTTWQAFAAPQYHYGRFAGEQPDDFYSVGYQEVMHFNGTAWESMGTLNVDLPFVSFVGATQLPNGDVWAAGRTTAGSQAETVTALFVPCFEPPLGDIDGNGIVDLDDWALFGACLMGPGVAPDPACMPADLNSDGFVDLGDTALFQSAFTGL